MNLNNIQSLITLGYEAFKQKNYNEAIKVWQPVVDFIQNKTIDNMANLYLDLGKCYYRTQQYQNAQKIITQGLVSYPNDVNLLKLQGFNDEKLADFENALVAWQQVLSLYPNHQEAKQHIADIDKKLQQQERQKKASLDVQAFLQQIDEKLEKGLLKDAELDIEQSLQYYPNNHDLLLKYAQISQDLFIKFQRLLTLIILYPTSLEGMKAFLEVCSQDKKFVFAQNYWKKFIDNTQNTDYLVYQQYAEQAEKTNPKEAFWCWLNIYRQFPYNLQAKNKVQALATSLGLSKKVEIKLDEQQRQQQLQQISQLFKEGKTAFDKKEYQISNEIWQQAVDLAVDKSDIPADLYLGLGKSYIRSGEFSSANILLHQAIESYPDNYNIAFLLPYLLKQQKQWQEAIIAWQQLSEKFPNMMSAKIELAESYKQLNELDKAQEIYQTIIQKDNNHFDAYLNLARLLMKKGEFSQALQIWSKIKDKWQNKINGHLGMAICYKNLSEYEKACQTIEQAFSILPNNPQLLDELVDVIYRSQDYQKGYDKLEKLVFDNVEMLEYQKARLLVKLKKFDEAEQKFKAVVEQYPNFARVYLGFADFYKEQRRDKENIPLLQSAYEKFPENQSIVARFIQSLMDLSENEKAYQIYEKSLQDKESPDSLLKYRHLINQFSDKKVDIAKLYQQYPKHLDIAVKYAQICLNSYEQEMLEKGVTILKDIQKENPHLNWLKVRLVHALLKANNESEAVTVAKSISDVQNDTATLAVFAWLAQKEGNFDKSKALWREITNKKYFASIHGNIGDLTYKGNKEIVVEKDDILMFSPMFNEMIHIPFLLDYYRKLGVNKFFIIDNNSTDETAEYLLAQPDVYYFWASSSFKESGCGMAWENYLMDKYAQGNWCVVIDADEYLVYPNIENKKLPELTKYLDEHGYEALASFMLAMYPEDVEHQLDIKSGDNLIEKSPYFCKEHYFKPDVMCPYIHVSGGFYHKNEKIKLYNTWSTKTPLIKRVNDIKHTTANHLITSAKVADITSCLLHFKMVGDFEKKARLHIERKEHGGGADAYKQYVKLYGDGQNEKFTDVEGTTKFENSQQLVNLGLIKNPRNF